MLHHVKDSLGNTYPDYIILRHDTKDPNDTSEEMAEEILNLVASVKTNEVFISALIVRNDKLNKKDTDVNELLMGKSGIKQLLFIDNKNINLNTMNKCGIHLMSIALPRLVNNFCYNMNAEWYKICMDTQDTPLAKNISRNLIFNIYNSNTDRPYILL